MLYTLDRSLYFSWRSSWGLLGLGTRGIGGLVVDWAGFIWKGVGLMKMLPERETCTVWLEGSLNSGFWSAGKGVMGLFWWGSSICRVRFSRLSMIDQGYGGDKCPMCPQFNQW